MSEEITDAEMTEAVSTGYARLPDGGLLMGMPLSDVLGDGTFTPAGYQGPAQHTYTTGCDGFHEPGQCPRADRIEADGCECGSPTCRRGPAPVIADADL